MKKSGWSVGIMESSGETAGTVHVHCHCVEQAVVNAVEGVQLLRHFFGFAAEDRTVNYRAFVEIFYPHQAGVDTLDGVDLRTDALELYFVYRVESLYVAVERFHLVDVSARRIIDAVGVVGDALVGV